MGISQWASPTVPPPQSAPSADPPSTLPGPSATPPAVLALLLSLRNGKSEGGTAIGTVEKRHLGPRDASFSTSTSLLDLFLVASKLKHSRGSYIPPSTLFAVP